MQHIHLNDCPSTQDHLLELLSKQNGDYLVSCDRQLSGKGQGGKSWHGLEHALSLSLTTYPSNPITLTSLEMGVLVCNFFLQEFQIKLGLKWPNDILTNNTKKCGGILINNPSGDKIIVGIGLNLFGNQKEFPNDYKIPAGFIFNETIKYNKKDLSLKLAQYICNHRLQGTQIINAWNAKCQHLNQEVIIFDELSEMHGTFNGIGSNGQALLQTSQGLKELYNGSLKFKN
jgi:BirA family biotin operon repressor/biotin-[acetyl-CoA-carboxylase] ligase